MDFSPTFSLKDHLRRPAHSHNSKSKINLKSCYANRSSANGLFIKDIQRPFKSALHIRITVKRLNEQRGEDKERIRRGSGKAREGQYKTDRKRYEED